MLIVDTYNVLHIQGVLPPRLAGLGVPDLVRLVSVSRYAGRRLTLVCDGGPGGGVSGVRMHTAHILYAGSHLEADDVIEQLIERYHRGNSLDVVSTDRRLRRAASRRGARSITSERFLTHLVEDEQTPAPQRGHLLRAQVPLDAYSVGQWIREFGLTPGRR
ncbi:MAG: NYN domain-containing protein, partial [Phycisphaerales bacterium]|nr:NYN domain-containing protein [Phycisphaerales bacterium]